MADALSRQQDKEECRALAVSSLVPSWLEEVQKTYEDDVVQGIIKGLLVAPREGNYSSTKGVLYYEGKIYIGKQTQLREKIIQCCHQSPIGGHSGIKATLARIQLHFYWPQLPRQVTEWVASCEVCLRCKAEHCATPGLLQSLPIPETAWQDISIAFIEGLPMSSQFDTILVVVDRFTKYGHFLPLTHPFPVATVARLFLDQIFKLHGMPKKLWFQTEIESSLGYFGEN